MLANANAVGARRQSSGRRVFGVADGTVSHKSLRRMRASTRRSSIHEEASSPNGRQPRAVVRPELGVSRIYWSDALPGSRATPICFEAYTSDVRRSSRRRRVWSAAVPSTIAATFTRAARTPVFADRQAHTVRESGRLARSEQDVSGNGLGTSDHSGICRCVYATRPAEPRRGDPVGREEVDSSGDTAQRERSTTACVRVLTTLRFSLRSAGVAPPQIPYRMFSLTA